MGVVPFAAPWDDAHKGLCYERIGLLIKDSGVTLRTQRYLRRGHRAMRRGDARAAVEAFTAAAESAEGDPRGAMQLALAQARRGECVEARRTVEDMVRAFPENAVARLYAGRALLECGDAEAAEPHLIAAAAMQPENARIQQSLALCEFMRGNLARAAERFERTGFRAGSDFLALLSYEVEKRLAPTPPVVDRDLPDLLATSTPPAADCDGPVRSEIRAQPAAKAARRAARLESRVGRWSRVPLLGRIVRALASRKLARAGERAYDEGEYAAALALFEAGRRIDPDALITHLGAGLSALHLGRPNHAIERLAAGWRRTPGDPLLASSYADALYRSGRPDEALAMFERIEPAGPDDFHAHYGRGACLTALGRKQRALEQFRLAFEGYGLDTLDDCLLPSWHEVSNILQTN